MGKRYYLMPSGIDMTVMAYVAPLDASCIQEGVQLQDHHSVSVRMVRAGEWYQTVVDSFPTACALAENKLKELRRLVFSEGHHFNKLDGDIYILRRIDS